MGTVLLAALGTIVSILAAAFGAAWWADRRLNGRLSEAVIRRLERDW